MFPCRDCVMVEARDGVLLCERCYRRLRRHIEDAADIVGHLRSIADPTTAAVFDRIRVQSSAIEIPAPVAADLIDASNDITTTMNRWTVALPLHDGGLRVGGELARRRRAVGIRVCRADTGRRTASRPALADPHRRGTPRAAHRGHGPGMGDAEPARPADGQVLSGRCDRCRSAETR